MPDFDLEVASPESGLEGLAAFAAADGDPVGYQRDVVAAAAAHQLTERGDTIVLLSGPDERGLILRLAETLAAFDHGGTSAQVMALAQVVIGSRYVIVAAVDTAGSDADELESRLTEAFDDSTVRAVPVHPGTGKPIAGRDWQIWATVDSRTEANAVMAELADLLADHHVAASRLRSYPTSDGRHAVILEYTVAFRDLVRDFHSELEGIGHNNNIGPRDCSGPIEYPPDRAHPTSGPLGDATRLISLVAPAHPGLIQRCVRFLKRQHLIDDVEMLSLVRLQNHHLVTMVLPEWVPPFLDRSLREHLEGLYSSTADRAHVAAVSAAPAATDAVVDGHDPVHLRVDAASAAGVLGAVTSGIKKADENANIERFVSTVSTTRAGGMTTDLCRIYLQVVTRERDTTVATKIVEELEERQIWGRVVRVQPTIVGDYERLGDEPFQRAFTLGPF